MTEGKFTLRRAAGGVGHYARIVVSSSGGIEVEPSPASSRAWLAAARKGINDAISAVSVIGSAPGEWTVLAFEGVLADTTEEDAWAGAVMAVLDALALKGTLSYDGTWVVRLDNGVQLRCGAAK